MVIYGRDARTAPRTLKHLFSGNYRNAEANRLSGVYELLLRRASEAGSPGRFPRIVSSSVSVTHVHTQPYTPTFTSYFYLLHVFVFNFVINKLFQIPLFI